MEQSPTSPADDNADSTPGTSISGSIGDTITPVVKTSGILVKDEILKLIEERKLFIKPLLSSDQIGPVGIDFRLGYDFLVSIQGREAYINTSKNVLIENGDAPQRNIHQFFQSTRRQIGETFILHPHQTVLTVTLEYVRMPDDCLLVMYMRSSYLRLGITVSAITQPGYCGCLSLELTNNNNNPINLAVGARILQGQVHRVSSPAGYFHTERKYVCQVRPEPSAVINDKDLDTLNQIWKDNNNRITP
jgi:dCTP deaminase